jgi:hypothetical protein
VVVEESRTAPHPEPESKFIRPVRIIAVQIRVRVVDDAAIRRLTTLRFVLAIPVLIGSITRARRH